MSQEPLNPRKIRGKYTPQFKDLVLARAEKEGIPQVAKELGISNSMIYDWRSKHVSCGTSLENKKVHDIDVLRLKRENARLQEENTFLKKAAVFFAKESR